MTLSSHRRSSTRHASRSPTSSRSKRYALLFLFFPVSYRAQTEPTLGYTYPHVALTLRQGMTLAPYYFHNGGLRGFIHEVASNVRLSQDPDNPRLLIVNDTVRRSHARHP